MIYSLKINWNTSLFVGQASQLDLKLSSGYVEK
jgi:hypothetical protein